MAKIVIRCQYTGHYVFTGIDTRRNPHIAGGRIYCPYCAADHLWTCTDARPDQHEPQRKPKPLVRLAV